MDRIQKLVHRLSSRILNLCIKEDWKHIFGQYNDRNRKFLNCNIQYCTIYVLSQENAPPLAVRLGFDYKGFLDSSFFNFLVIIFESKMIMREKKSSGKEIIVFRKLFLESV